MKTKYRRPEEQGGVLASLSTALDSLNRAKEETNVAPANAAFASANVLLTTIRVGPWSMLVAS